MPVGRDPEEELESFDLAPTSRTAVLFLTIEVSPKEKLLLQCFPACVCSRLLALFCPVCNQPMETPIMVGHLKRMRAVAERSLRKSFWSTVRQDHRLKSSVYVAQG
jgi:hypothetical protein